MDELIERLIHAIESRSIPLEAEIWDADTVAGYLRVSRRTVLEHFSPRPDFPAGIRLPGRGKSDLVRWKAIEVMGWAESKRDKAA